jgi:hypothetical protein
MANQNWAEPHSTHIGDRGKSEQVHPTTAANSLSNRPLTCHTTLPDHAKDKEDPYRVGLTSMIWTALAGPHDFAKLVRDYDSGTSREISMAGGRKISISQPETLYGIGGLLASRA